MTTHTTGEETPVEHPPGEYAIVERWLPVVGFEQVYEVSDQGRVRRVGRAHISGKGRGGGVRVGRILALCQIAGGYYAVNLWRHGKIKRRLIHALVMEAFVGLPPKDHEVNHRDGVKSHNDLDNLEYVTRSQNMIHAYAIGLREKGRDHPLSSRRGEEHPNSKLTLSMVAEIRRMRAVPGSTLKSIANRMGVHWTTVARVANGRTWAND